MTTATALPAVTCPDCGAPMRIRTARKGAGAGRPFWGCSTWPKCSATHGAHPDGRPLGIPGDKATKAARIRAHAAFDQLWKEGGMSRGAAYRWMRRALDLTEEQAHIGRFTIGDCERLIAMLAERSPHPDPLAEIGDYDTEGMGFPDDH